MTGIKAYLSKREKSELVEFVAAVGENYDRYLEWCEKHSAKPFSRNYFKRWVQRRRYIIQQIRLKQKDEIRRLSTYNKDRRLEELERVSEYLLSTIDQMVSHDVCSPTCKPVETLIKLMEQHRKTLEAIAKERGEFNKPEESPLKSDTRAILAKKEALARLSTGRQIVVIQPNSDLQETSEEEDSEE